MGALRCLAFFSFFAYSLNAQQKNELDQYGYFGAPIFTDIKSAMAAEKQVFKLDLNYQAIDSRAASKIQNFGNLQVLRLRDNGLSTYPEGMERLSNLVYFSSYNNRFRTFLPNPQAYRSLYFLELQHSAIDSIPASIAYLGLLTTFRFGNTNDTLKLPATLPYLKKLKELSIENCVMDSFPKVIFRLSGLRFLSLSNTNTKFLSSHFERLPALEVLVIENNLLEKLPFDIYKASQLRIISLRGNKLRSIPPSIGQLEHLTVLDLRGNPIAPEDIDVLRALLPGCEVKF